MSRFWPSDRSLRYILSEFGSRDPAFTLYFFPGLHYRLKAKIIIPVEYTALIVVGCLVAARQPPEHVDHVKTIVVQTSGKHQACVAQ